MIRDDCRRLSHSKWLIPAFCLAFGVVVVLVSWLGRQLAVGLIGLVIMACFGLLVALAGGSETIRGLRGDGTDERFAQIDLRATAVAGLALIIAVIVAFLVEVARGHSGSPYDWLGAVGGVAYAVAVAYFRWRG
jgi:uncharacterized membrane protein